MVKMPNNPDPKAAAAQMGQQIGDKVRKFQEKMAKEPVPEILNRPELQNRAVAILTDAMAAILFFFVVAIPGSMIASSSSAPFIRGGAAVLSALFLLFRDGVGGRSPGKRLVGLKVIRTEGQAPVDPVTSAMRNWPIAMLFAGPILDAFLSFVPGIGLIASAAMLASVGLVGHEIYRVLVDRTAGARLGDTMAKTRVVEE